MKKAGSKCSMQICIGRENFKDFYFPYFKFVANTDDDNSVMRKCCAFIKLWQEVKG